MAAVTAETPKVLLSVPDAKQAVERARTKLGEVERSFAHAVVDRTALAAAERALHEAEIRLREAERLEGERAATERRKSADRFRQLSHFVKVGHLEELSAICESVAEDIARLEVETLERVRAHLKKVKSTAYDAEALSDAVDELGGRVAFDRAVDRLHGRADDADRIARGMVREALGKKLVTKGRPASQLANLMVQRFVAEGAAPPARR